MVLKLTATSLKMLPLKMAFIEIGITSAGKFQGEKSDFVLSTSRFF